jgi:hypothetical protein
MADLPPAGLDPARVRAAYDGANGLAAASTTFWVLSAISAVGAGVLFVLEAPPGAFQFTPSEPAPPPDAISLQVAPAPGGASVSLLARF